MKICWDTLAKLRYNKKTGKWYTKTKIRYIYKEKCLCCGEPFLVSQSILNEIKNGKAGKYAGKFCSKVCKRSYMVKSKAPNFKNKTIVKVCGYCGVRFNTRRLDAIYCSNKCKSKDQKKEKIKFICDYCGKEYGVYPSLVVVHKSRSHEHNFCSKACMSAFYVGSNSPNWVEDRDTLKDQNKSIRWSKRMNDWRLSVFNRDNFTCAMCGNRSSKGNPVILNAHHIKPFSKYKHLRFEESNGITLCDACHKKTYWKESQFQNEFENYVSHK